MWNRNQMKQAWYRCIDFMDKRMTAAEVNAFYSVTLRELYVHTEPVPAGVAGRRHVAGRRTSIGSPRGTKPEILRLVRRARHRVLRAARDLASAVAPRASFGGAPAGSRSPIGRTCRRVSCERRSSAAACSTPSNGGSCREPSVSHGAHDADSSGAGARCIAARGVWRGASSSLACRCLRPRRIRATSRSCAASSKACARSRPTSTSTR